MRIARLALVTAVVGCSGGGTSPVPPPPPPPPPVFTSVSVTPPAPTIQPGTNVQLTATPLDQNGHAMAGLPAAVWASDTSATVSVDANGLATAHVLGGPVNITGTITSGAIVHAGNSAVTVANIPNQADVTATTGLQFVPDSVDISANGSVTWTFQSVTHNVHFSPVAGAPGDIGNTANAAVGRAFTTPGVFHYTCTIHGMQGVVVVH